jgi:hypothetical protein
MTRAVRHGSEIDVVTVAMSSDRPLTLAATAATFDGADIGVAIRAPAVPVARIPLIRRMAGGLEDVVLLILVVLFFPLGVLLIGTPIAVCVRALMAIAHRL